MLNVKNMCSAAQQQVSAGLDWHLPSGSLDWQKEIAKEQEVTKGLSDKVSKKLEELYKELQKTSPGSFQQVQIQEEINALFSSVQET